MAKLSISVNGRTENVDADGKTVLLDVIRDRLHLTGTKEGCREGECGACTVLIDGRPVDSCIYPALAADGSEVTTVEGLAQDGRLNAIQKAMVENGGVQCGFCTPGIVVMLTSLLESNSQPDAQTIRDAISGNICRCTGYAQIEDAVMDAIHATDAAGT